MFKGVFTATITPFKNNKVDFESFKKFIEFQIENGVDGIVPVGTTGEGATLTKEETREVFKFVKESFGDKIKVIGGTGSNSTHKAIENTKLARECNLDGVLIVTPYYNKPTQKGLIKHYTEIAKNVNIPIVLYNVPGRTGVNLEASTVVELSKINNIVGVKEASGNIDQITTIIRNTDDSFSLLSGEDMNNLPILSVGGDGFISVTSNVAPKLVSMLYKNFKENNISECTKIHLNLCELTKHLFVETNPIPIKASVNLLGYCEKEIRLPLVWVSEALLESLQSEMTKLNLINQ